MGMILGTAAYMAPEQARGRAVDRRADIWAFGAVLWEMLTGRRAFDGDDVSITLASVLKDDPKWDALGSDVPPALRQLVRRCLDKDPKRRLQAIGEARVVIEDLLSGAAPRGIFGEDTDRIVSGARRIRGSREQAAVRRRARRSLSHRSARRLRAGADHHRAELGGGVGEEVNRVVRR